MSDRALVVAALIAVVGSSLACKNNDTATSAAASSSAATAITTTAPLASSSAPVVPAASVTSVTSAAVASAKPTFTATPGVKWDPHGYPGGFASECDHKLNKVTKQPEEYAGAPACEQKWAPSCEAVLKCIKGDPAFR